MSVRIIKFYVVNIVDRVSLRESYDYGGWTVFIEMKCSECDLTFKSATLRSEHFKHSHPGKNIYHCTHCDYGTNYLSNLKSHVNSLHEKISPHCDKCNFTTTWNQSYHSHMREEHGVCQRKTKHSSQKLSCKNCAFTTFYKTNLSKHNAQVHNQGKMYQCDKCELTTFYKHALLIHVKRKHPDTNVVSKAFTSIW